MCASALGRDDHGPEVINPALKDGDFAAAHATAQAEFGKHQPQVVVGSSRGGALAMNINSGNANLVLLGPAWKNWDNWGQSKGVAIQDDAWFVP